MNTAAEPTTDELIERVYQVDGKAVIANGKIARMSPSGDPPISARGEAANLRQLAKVANGRACPDAAAFLVNRPVASRSAGMHPWFASIGPAIQRTRRSIDAAMSPELSRPSPAGTCPSMN